MPLPFFQGLPRALTFPHLNALQATIPPLKTRSPQTTPPPPRTALGLSAPLSLATKMHHLHRLAPVATMSQPTSPRLRQPLGRTSPSPPHLGLLSPSLRPPTNRLLQFPPPPPHNPYSRPPTTLHPWRSTIRHWTPPKSKPPAPPRSSPSTLPPPPLTHTQPFVTETRG